MTATDPTLRQRADLTRAFNATGGRHGWLRLTPAYSRKIVAGLLDGFDAPRRVLDPFCGTATTALAATERGHAAVTTDINPFLVWLGRVKTARYRPDELAATRAAGDQAVFLVRAAAVAPAMAPPIHDIGRWWSPAALRFLCGLRGAIEAAATPGSPEHALLLVAFCRTLIGCSNAAFDHQSMSFKTGAADRSDAALGEAFLAELRFVLDGAAANPPGAAEVLLGDARRLPEVATGPFDCVVTSPPYANRMSYIRELRPYMYWLGFLTNGRDAGELDWAAIGGTWGVATSRLTDWEPNGTHFASEHLDGALAAIAAEHNKNGKLLGKYVAKYMADMWAHFDGLRAVLAPGAELHYIVGNSSFYGVLLPVEQLYAEMLTRLGFADVACRPLRKRNSKKELIEFDVTARWSG